MTTPIEQGTSFWDDMAIKTKFQPYSIMFMVEDSCPIYMDDHRDWVEYAKEAYPAHSITAFIVEGELSLGNQRLSLHLYNLWSSYLQTVENHGVEVK